MAKADWGEDPRGSAVPVHYIPDTDGDGVNDEDDKFKAMNPPNGWGSYAGFIDFLEEVLKLSNQYPKSIWSSWR